MLKFGRDRWGKFVLALGVVIWCPLAAFLWFHLHQAHSFAEASVRSTQLSVAAFIGIVWGLTGAILRKKSMQQTTKNARIKVIAALMFGIGAFVTWYSVDTLCN